ncbi:MAG: family 78 glycoside hydrolase catalytic domain [Clostridia bacterium]|nr:family 78 glycoside hydrolase catalytic domain [Clostridia bacterium]
MQIVIYPKKIIDGRNFVNAKNLLKQKSMQIGLNEPELTTIENGGYVVLDFGKEICGSFRLLAHVGSGDRKVRIVYGESVSEALSKIGEKGATNDHIVRDGEYYIPDYSDTTFTNSGFRFVTIQTVGNSVIKIKNAVVTPTVYKKAYKGKFVCDDKRINKIFQTAAWTLKLCLQNGMVWDGIKRDRLVWIGDMNPETLSANCLFGEIPHIENSLTFAKEQSPLPLWMNNFPTYSLWWIVNLRDYYFQNKNIGYLIEQKEYLQGLLKQVSSLIRDDGTCAFDFIFIDWPSHYVGDGDEQKRLDEIAGTHALTVYAVDCARQILQILGEDVALCEDMLARLRKKTYKTLKFKQIAGIRIISGEGAEDDAKLIVDGGAKGMSTFMSYFILKGASKCGYVNESLDMMKDYYGAMLDLGATSFWEDFDISWAENAGRIDRKPSKNKKDVHGDYGAFCYLGFRHSLCHGWSSGVVPFLMGVIAGIEIVKPGCEEIRIKPNLGYLNHVKVDYPTPFGILKVEHTKNADGSITTTTKVPNGVKIVR